MTTTTGATTRAGTSVDGEVLSLRMWLQLMKCSKAIEAGAAAHLRRAHGQSLARFDVLSQLYRLEHEWATVGEIAGMVMASSGNITGLIDRMEADGLIVRRASPFDRRSQQIRMTHRGHVLFDDMTRDHAGWIDAALIGVADEDKSRLIELLVGVRVAFENNAARMSGTE
ncbi:MAG: MarR family transcriptional regulator [Rhodospirillaceae bacterium]